MLTIYHNPRCRKSREALAALEQAGVPLQVHLYLETPMPAELLMQALAQLGPDVMLRSGEDDYKTHIKGKHLSSEQLVMLMQSYPKTIERPLIVADNGQMVMGRPVEAVLTFITGIKKCKKA